MHRLVACLLLLASSSAVAQDAGVCRIVVLNLVAKNLPAADKDLPAVLTETLARQVTIESGCQVMTQADLTEMLDFEAAKQGCTDGTGDSCLAELGAAMGAERVVGGSLGRLGGDFVLNARLMNVKSGVVDARAEQVVPGAPEKLRLAAQNVGRQLFGSAVVVDTAPAVGAPAAAGPSPLLFVGAGAGVVGIGSAVVGGLLVGAAESRLSDAEARDKTAALTQGRIGVALVAAGGVLVVAGAVVAAVSLVME